MKKMNLISTVRKFLPLLFAMLILLPSAFSLSGCQPNTKQNDHDHKYTSTVIQPTCSTQGYTLHTCSECGGTIKNNFKNATGNHNYTFSQKVKPTCQSGGYTQYRCTSCNKIDNRDVVEKGNHTGVGRCSVCHIDIWGLITKNFKEKHSSTPSDDGNPEFVFDFVLSNSAYYISLELDLIDNTIFAYISATYKYDTSAFAVTLSKDGKVLEDGEYVYASWFYLSDDDDLMMGTMYPSTFNEKLSTPYYSNVSSYLQETTLSMASALCNMLLITVNAEFASSNADISNIGYTAVSYDD